jgi:hypothetical protein
MYAPTKEERSMAMLCHLLGLIGGLIPPANIIAPLIIWLVKKDQMPFVNDQGKEALNFQISMTIYFIISFILMFVLIGLVLIPVLGILWLVFGIVATIKANEGVAYRYPLTIRLIR